MLCTSCTREVRPVVAVDIDGTLGDYHGHFIKFAADYVDMPAREVWLSDGGRSHMYDSSRAFREWFCDLLEVDLTTFREIKLAYRAGAQKRSMPVYAGASAIMGSLPELGCEVWLTTTRPYLRLDGIDKDTREWLRRNDIKYDYLLYDEKKYRILAENVGPQRVVAVLDDEVEQLTTAEAIFGPSVPILRRTRYNRAARWAGASTLTLMEAQGLIDKRVQDWRGAHD